MNGYGMNPQLNMIETKHKLYGNDTTSLRLTKLDKSSRVNCFRSSEIFKATIKDNINKFLKNSSIHSLKYIGDEEISKVERYLFGIAFCVAVLISAYYITLIYTKWTTTPIIITTSSVSTPITAIPFPAITICNMNQAKKSRVQNIKPGTLDYSLIQSLCIVDNDIGLEYTGKSGTWQHFRQFILNVSQPCRELLVSCRYGSKVMNCGDIFDPVLTDEGLCCTFNTVNPKYMLKNYDEDDNLDILKNSSKLNAVDWTPEMGYQENINAPYSPLPGFGTGNHMGLTIMLNASLNDYFCSSTSSVGFKVLLHNPSEMPKISSYGFAISTGTENRVVITPEIQNSARNIRSISIKHRHCLFANEANSSYYRTYSKTNCELECESYHLEEECGCVLYHMPRNSNDSIICGLKDLLCTQRVKLETESVQSNSNKCDSCLPACFSLNYLSSVTSSLLSNNEFMVREKFTKKIPKVSVDSKNLAMVHFFYLKNSFRANTREELLGFVDFIANSGGILGLFMGFSILSVIELIYFFSLAPYCASKNNLKSYNDRNDNMDVNSTFNIQSYQFSNQRNCGSRVLLSSNMSDASQKIDYVKPRNKINRTDEPLPYCE